jgi:hypothetical protein
MIKVEIPMYRENGSQIQLIDFLEKIEDNKWIWNFVEFDGIHNDCISKKMIDFSEKINKKSNGLICDWSELLEFSKTIEYTVDCLIVAVSSFEFLNINDFLMDEFENCNVAIRAIDSTTWLLSSSNKDLINEFMKVSCS